MGHKHHKHKCCGYEKYECCGPSCGCNNFNNLFDGCCGNSCGGGWGNNCGSGCNNPLILLVLLGLFCRR
ncbi:hypothetical protein HYI18_13105 [Clostridium botulinum]|uniref:hypothetical protein n=1 Tax=Clostridium botulinum TaxID=1491 RepID=UPI001748D987|nr:hypothetical protein [Clostridium botulinum]MBD5639512.1 hypothetical protein [Clostridium botulinum]MDI6921834.1 hypothetical protein [Clostridium botulinum]